MMDRKNIDRLIVNSPYGEPECYWRYNRKARTFSLAGGPAARRVRDCVGRLPSLRRSGRLCRDSLGKPDPTPCEGMAGGWLRRSHWHHEAIA